MRKWILGIALALTGITMYLLVEATRAQSTAPPGPVTAHAPMPAGHSGPGASGWSNARPAIASDDARQGSSAPPPPAPEHAGSAAPSGEEMRDRIETAFRADSPVAASQDRARGLEQGVLAALPAGSTLRNVECRSALCRIETLHADPEQFRDFARRAFLGHASRITSGPVFAGIAVEPRPGEPVVAVAYVGRDDSTLTAAASLPQPDRADATR